MRVSLRQIRSGAWAEGWVLDKHVVSSTYVGDSAQGRPQFNTVRTDVGEATYQLKYRQDWTQVEPLARALASHIYPKFDRVDLIIPMPPTTPRPRQPVIAVAAELGKIVDSPVHTDLLYKTPPKAPLKDLQSKDEKLAAITDCFRINPKKTVSGNLLLIDDLFDTGASMEAACAILRGIEAIGSIYVAALTCK